MQERTEGLGRAGRRPCERWPLAEEGDHFGSEGRGGGTAALAVLEASEGHAPAQGVGAQVLGAGVGRVRIAGHLLETDRFVADPLLDPQLADR